MKTLVIWRGHQVGVKGHFRYRFKGTINYVSTDIYWFKDMIKLGRYNTDVH